MSTKKLAHVVWDCKYHILIVAKYRHKVFSKNIREAVRDEIKKLCVWLSIEVIEGHVSKDHIHMCLAIPPKHSISDIIGTLKGKVAIRLFNRFPDIRKRYWVIHFKYISCAEVINVNTLGRNEEQIRQYIRDQDKLDRLENQGKLFESGRRWPQGYPLPTERLVPAK
jgi:putative transposase